VNVCVEDLSDRERNALADRIERSWYQVQTREVLGLRPRTLIVSSTGHGE
jgi:hypothetical protein